MKKVNKSACGCGGYAKVGNRYISGYNKSTLGQPSKLKGKTFVEICGEEKTNEISDKIRESKLGSKNPAYLPEVQLKNRERQLKRFQERGDIKIGENEKKMLD